MDKLQDDTIGGFNSLIEEQKKLDGEAMVTVVQFDDEYIMTHNQVDISEVEKLTRDTFVPRGMTALLDSMGKLIRKIGRAHTHDCPTCVGDTKVIFTIITDGLENVSKKYTNTKIAEMVRHQEKKHGWNFVFVGANQDAFNVGGNLGINRDAIINWTANAGGTRSLYSSVSKNIGAVRSGMVANYAFTEADTAAQTNAKN